MILTFSLQKTLQSVFQSLNLKTERFSVWFSLNVKDSHCYSNAIILIAKLNAVSEKTLANQVITLIKKTETNIVKVVFANGFLNFYFQTSFLNSILGVILTKREEFGSFLVQKKGLVSYEWVSANPTGYLHIGHARNIFVGQAIVNILSFVGYKVVKEFYINDYGNQMFQLGRTVFYHYHQLLNHPLPHFTGMYQNAETILIAKEIVDKFAKRYLGSDFCQNLEIQSFFIQFAKNFFLLQMQKDLANWGISFDCWFSEKSLYEKNGLNLFLERMRKKKLIYSRDGAVWFKTLQPPCLDNFVLVKGNGEPTYFVGDLMYHEKKFAQNYELIINLLGSDHHHHHLRIRSGLVSLGFDVTRFQVDLLQMVKMVENGQILKISKRQGNSIYLRDLVKEFDLNFLKFMLMFRQRTTKIVFDLSLIKTKNSQNPFFYTHYAYSRCCQILSKVDHQLLTPQKNYVWLNDVLEEDLVLALHCFSDVVQKAAKTREPQILVAYALKLSKKFHLFYEKIPVLNAPIHYKKERVHLVFAVFQILQQTLKLLGISLPKQM